MRNLIVYFVNIIDIIINIIDIIININKRLLTVLYHLVEGTQPFKDCVCSKHWVYSLKGHNSLRVVYVQNIVSIGNRNDTTICIRN